MVKAYSACVHMQRLCTRRTDAPGQKPLGCKHMLQNGLMSSPL